MDIKFKYDDTGVMAILLDPKGQSISIKIKQPAFIESDLPDPNHTKSNQKNKKKSKTNQSILDTDKDANYDNIFNSGVPETLPVNFLPREYGSHIK